MLENLIHNSKYVNEGHFNTIGYIEVAKEIATICNKTIEDNYNAFKLSALIGTEWQGSITQ